MRQSPKNDPNSTSRRKSEGITRRGALAGLSAAIAAALAPGDSEAAGTKIKEWPDFPKVITPEHASRERELWINDQVRQYQAHLKENTDGIENGTPQHALEILHANQPYIDEKLTYGIEKYDIRELIEKYCFTATWLPGQDSKMLQLKLIPPGKEFDADRRAAAKYLTRSNAFFITPTILLVASHAFLPFNPRGKVGHGLLSADVAIVQVPKGLAQWERTAPVDFRLQNSDMEGRFIAFGGYDIDQWANPDGSKIYAGVLAPQDGPVAKAYIL